MTTACSCLPQMSRSCCSARSRRAEPSLIDQDCEWDEGRVTWNGFADAEFATESLTQFSIFET